MKINMKIIVSLLPFFFLFTSSVYANLDDSIFVIKSTWPSSGQTNVPTNLISGLAGSVSSGEVGSIAVGYGTDLSGGCGNPPNCPSIPKIDKESVKPSTLFVSCPNISDISIKYVGDQECSGNCYGSDSFYHNFTFVPISSSFPKGIKLSPNTTCTITIKGGVAGISALRGTKRVYLPSDYSWSFTTGDGNQPLSKVEEDFKVIQQKMEEMRNGAEKFKKAMAEELKKKQTTTPTPPKKLTPTKSITPPIASPSATIIPSVTVTQPATPSVEISPAIKQSLYSVIVQSFLSAKFKFVSFFQSLFSAGNTNAEKSTLLR